ncbi:MAG: hypothetical protein WC438_01680 [Candidatus Pacearchaeota archaeon]
MNYIATGFIGLGIIECLISNLSCTSLCSVCNFAQLKPCFFLLIFVGLIFMISGLSLLSFKGNSLPEIKIKKSSK